MVKITVVDLEGTARDIDAETGVSLMEAIRDNGFADLAAICGGCCSCCTCHVYVDEKNFCDLPEKSEAESFLLESSELYKEDSSRLSCQIKVTEDMNGLKVTIVPEF